MLPKLMKYTNGSKAHSLLNNTIPDVAICMKFSIQEDLVKESIEIKQAQMVTTSRILMS